MKKIFILFTLLILVLTSCGTSNAKFEYWNESSKSLNTLREYVSDVTNKNSKNYIPECDRIATFDMDGTLYGELFPTYFEYLLFCHRVLDDKTYTQATPEMIETATTIRQNKYTWNMTQPGLELKHAHGQAQAFSGMTVAEFEKYVKDFLNTKAEGFNNLLYKDAFYLPMIELVKYLQENKFMTYIVSGSDRFICRALASEAFNIPYNQIIGMDVVLEAENQNGVDGLEYQFTQTDKLIRTGELLIKNLKMNKVTAITKEIGKQPVLAFGNSSGDVSMLNYAMTNPKYKGAGFMVVADDEKDDFVSMAETNKRIESWNKYGYNIFSMKDDFKTIYGYSVSKIS